MQVSKKMKHERETGQKIRMRSVDAGRNVTRDIRRENG